MSTPTKAPTAKPAETPKRKPPVRIEHPDYSGLKLVTAPAKAVHRNTSSAVDKTPFPAMIRDSWDRRDSDTPAVTVQVPHTHALSAVTLIRQAAKREGLGARIKPDEKGIRTVKPGPDGNVSITFQAVPKRAKRTVQP